MSILEEVRAAVAAENYQLALANIERAIDADELDAELLLLRAECYERTGDRKRAFIDYTNLSKLLGDPPETLLGAALQLSHLGHHKEELVLYDKILASSPNFFDALYMKALRLVKMGEYADCLTFIDRAIAINPEHGNAHYTKACAHALRGEADAAIDSVRRAIAVDRDLRWQIAMDDDFANIADDPRFIAATKDPDGK